MHIPLIIISSSISMVVVVGFVVHFVDFFSLKFVATFFKISYWYCWMLTKSFLSPFADFVLHK